MPVSLIIPDDVVAALKLPPRNVAVELYKELAVHLYSEGLLPQANACRLAGLTRLAFERLLAERGIPTRLTPAELDRDVQILSRE